MTTPSLRTLYSPPEPQAILSEDRLYRYTLLREWDADRQRVAFVGLNPSTADENENDPTIRKCIGFARRWGFGGIYMLNLFAWRSTDPDALTDVADPIGPENDLHIETTIKDGRVARVVAAWGSHKVAKRNARADRVLDAIAKIHAPILALKLSKHGAPWHPLYMPYDSDPVEVRS